MRSNRNAADGLRLRGNLTRRQVLRGGVLAAGGLWLSERAAFGAIGPQSSTSTSAESEALSTRCEGLTDPLGLQTPHPRLSWTAAGEPRSGARQAAYQVVLSSSPNDESADFWNTGKVTSSDLAAEYAGKAIPPHTQVFWRVRTWDSAEGEPSAWSAPARWSAGPANEDDWGGSRWIGREDLLESTQDQMPGAPGKPKEPTTEQPATVQEIELHATASSGLPVRFFVVAGPVELEGDRLHFTEVPGAGVRSIEVTVVAYQYGRIQSANPVTRSFHILRSEKETQRDTTR
jgi:hypothetical protein